LVLVIPKTQNGPQVISQASEIQIHFKGVACNAFAPLMQQKFKLVQKVSLKDQQWGCAVRLLPRPRYRLKKAFLLAGERQDQSRFVMDFTHQTGQAPKAQAEKAVHVLPVANAKSSHNKTNLQSPPLAQDDLWQPKLLMKPFRPSIVIDAGHGGYDPGSISSRGVFEKTVTLAAAKRIAAILKKSGRYHVKLTRNRDIFVPKRERFAIARAAKADFFISIHADNHSDKKLQGLTIYTLSSIASDKEAARLAKQENSDEFLSGFSLESKEAEVSNILIALSQAETNNVSLQVAKHLHENIAAAKFTKLMTLRSADLAVLKAPDTPSLLIELGYLSNLEDEKLIQKPDFQKKVADHLLKALDNYFNNRQRKHS
jgi:N-acetylmuramoyl-L-alanine amidase